MTNPDSAQEAYNDEIDLRDLVLVLIEGWYWILGAVVIFTVAALAYVLVKTPIYETDFRAVPAPVANFSGFNLLDDDFSISPEDAYRAFANRLSSYQNFQSFFEQHQDRFQLEKGAATSNLFSNRFSVSGGQPAQDESMLLTAEYSYPEGEQGAEILNAYAQHTAETVWVSLRDQFHEYNRAQIARLQTDLELQKESLKREREDRLFTLEQAISVARRLGIEKPTTPQEFGRQPSDNDVIYANISGDGSLPLYFMGYQALEAERDTLRAEIDKGLSNSGIRNSRQELEQHKRIAELLDNESLRGVDEGVKPNPAERVVAVVEYAFPAQNPSEPEKTLVLALALVLGVMAGVVLAFMARFASSIRGYRRSMG